MVDVALIIGSDSDRELGDRAADLLKEFGVNYDYKVISAHRNPEYLSEYVRESNAKVFIAIAGLAAALPGAIAAQTIKPVIGVPKNVSLGGLDSLLSIVQMPTGVPVAAVAIDNSRNAVLLAVEILSLNSKKLERTLLDYREKRSKRL
jgi:5-(carboxyamino)imidazole ribonucleotide mutase